jgi:hypothetical protein
MIVVKLPWVSRCGAITIRKKGKAYTATIKGERPTGGKPRPGSLISKAEGEDPKAALDAAMAGYNKQAGNYEAIRHASINFHEMFGYVLVHQQDGLWEYESILSEKVQASNLPNVSKQRAHQILQILLYADNLGARSLSGWLRHGVAMGAGYAPPITVPEVYAVITGQVSQLLRIDV